MKLQRLYTEGVAAYGFVRNLVKASRSPVSKVRQFSYPKAFFTKFALATGKAAFAERTIRSLKNFQ